MLQRQAARETAFAFVFEKLFNPEVSLASLAITAREEELFECDDYVLRLCSLIFSDTGKIDSVISAYLKKGWAIGRLPKVTLSILRIAIGELLYFDSIPDSVSVNEAVELAKKYGDESAPAFINGLLGSVISERNEKC